MSDGQPGLLSSVLGYLSREVQDFVTTAAGGSTTESVVASSSSRPRARSKREAQRSRKERLNENKQDEDEEEEWRERHLASRRLDNRIRPNRRTSYSPTPPNTEHSDERVSHDGHSDEDAGAENRQEEDEEEEEEPAPLPLPRALRRRPSITMPGALFPRSPSMDPEPRAAAVRHVRFPAQPTYFDFDVPVPGPSSSPERPRPASPIPRRPRAESVREVSRQRVRGDNASAGDAVPSGPSWNEKGKQCAAQNVFLESEASSSPSRLIGAGSGEGCVRDAGLEPASADPTGEIRVRGKERELSAVREERRACEERWETEAETTLIREEKVEYEDRIKQLEEEVQRLRAEVRIIFFPL
ncbi:hypothetical protein BJV74DRAFT_863298 [Russula compacta]|nr:hypothetical protein BJV74DRAFT_863298 [Russula compacta]